MGASPDQLVADIERHREELGAALDEIHRRLKPSYVVRSNPWPFVGLFALVGGFVAWRLARRH